MTKKDCNNIGDIVCVMKDDHIFSPAEIGGFDIIQIDGTREEVETGLQELVDVPIVGMVNTSSLSVDKSSPNGIKVPDDQKPNYPFRVVDKTASDITSMCQVNL